MRVIPHPEQFVSGKQYMLLWKGVRFVSFYDSWEIYSGLLYLVFTRVRDDMATITVVAPCVEISDVMPVLDDVRIVE